MRLESNPTRILHCDAEITLSAGLFPSAPFSRNGIFILTVFFELGCPRLCITMACLGLPSKCTDGPQAYSGEKYKSIEGH